MTLFSFKILRKLSKAIINQATHLLNHEQIQAANVIH